VGLSRGHFYFAQRGHYHFAATGDIHQDPFIKDRAKAYGEQAAPDGTRYVAITDNDVRGKSPDQIAAILAPKVNAEDVRKLDMVIDLKRPVTLSSNTNEPVNIGTAQVTAASHLNLDVRSQISISKVKVVPK
jgi:hypothetical protein